MRRLTLVVAVVAIGLAVCGPAAAQEKKDPSEITTGIIEVGMNVEFARAFIDGEEWENSYSEGENTMMIAAVDRTQDHQVKVAAFDDALKPEEFKVETGDWKLVKVDKTTREWRVVKKVTFRAWKPGEKEKYDALNKPKETRPPEEKPKTPTPPVPPETPAPPAPPVEEKKDETPPPETPAPPTPPAEEKKDETPPPETPAPPAPPVEEKKDETPPPPETPAPPDTPAPPNP
jgi:hypothetical protein